MSNICPWCDAVEGERYTHGCSWVCRACAIGAIKDRIAHALFGWLP